MGSSSQRLLSLNPTTVMVVLLLGLLLLLGLGCDNMQNFLNFKLQKCDACQNGVEFCHKPIGDDAVISETGFTLSRPILRLCLPLSQIRD